MDAKLNVITGATGLLGSHIAEQLRSTGAPVRALVRPGSDTSFLRGLGVELIDGDLLDQDAVRRAVDGAGIVYHCAARVTDWGPWAAFRDEAVTSTRNLVEACQAANIGRLLHVSSISVYGYPKLKPGEQITEEMPLGRNYRLWDYYPRSKVLAEEEVRRFSGPLTIVRPSWMVGPRDRMTIPRLVPALRNGQVRIIGWGNNLLNVIDAGDVAGGAILAANHAGAIGQAYNMAGVGQVTQKEMVDALADLLGLPRVGRHVPFAVAISVAFIRELFARLFRRAKPPTVTRRAIFLIGRPPQYSIAKARTQLGWQPNISIHDSVKRALAWYLGERESKLPEIANAPG